MSKVVLEFSQVPINSPLARAIRKPTVNFLVKMLRKIARRTVLSFSICVGVTDISKNSEGSQINYKNQPQKLSQNVLFIIFGGI